MLDTLLNDLRFAARALRRSPLVALAATACLSGSIAAATTVFAVVNGVVLRPLPFRHADALVSIWGVNPRRDSVRRGFSWPDLTDLAREVRSLDGVAAAANAPAGMTLTGAGEPVQIPARIVSGNFFDVLGVSAAVGRTLAPDQDVPGSQPAVTISHRLWRERFGSDPAMPGRAITLDGRPFVVTGVTPREFAYPPDAQMWVTVAHGAAEYVDNRTVGWLQMIGRARPGLSPAAIRADLSIPFDALAKRHHAARAREDLSVTRVQDELLGDTRLALWALLAGVLIVLLVACTNVGGLLLVRSTARQHELAVRIALGASRARVIAQSLAESLVLLTVSSVAGVALSLALVGAVRTWAPADIPGIAEIAVDWRVLVFAMSIAGAAVVICACAPALQSLSRDPIEALHGSGRSVTRDGGRLRRLLAGSEIAFAVVLMVAASLVGRTFLKLRAIDVGFRADRVLAFDVPQPATWYPDARASLAFADRLLPRLASLPGVQRASSVLLRPLWGVVGMDWPVVVEGQPQAESAQNPLANLEAVSPGYFDTMGIPILDGRDFAARDENGRSPVAVVSESFVKSRRDTGGYRSYFWVLAASKQFA